MISITLPGRTNEPVSTRTRPTQLDWVGLRERLQASPGVWIVAFDNYSSGMFSHLRKGRVHHLDQLGGTLNMRNLGLAAHRGINHGTLWLQWQPEGWTQADQDRVDAAVEAGEGVL